MSKKKRSGFPQIIYHSKEEIEFSQKTTFVTRGSNGDSVISGPEAGQFGLFWSFFRHVVWYIICGLNLTLTPKMNSDFKNFAIWKFYGAKTWKFWILLAETVWYMLLHQNFMLNLNLNSDFENFENCKFYGTKTWKFWTFFFRSRFIHVSISKFFPESEHKVGF